MYLTGAETVAKFRETFVLTGDISEYESRDYWSSSPADSFGHQLNMYSNRIFLGDQHRSDQNYIRCVKDNALRYRWQTGSTCSNTVADYTST